MGTCPSNDLRAQSFEGSLAGAVKGSEVAPDDESSVKCELMSSSDVFYGIGEDCPPEFQKAFLTACGIKLDGMGLSHDDPTGCLAELYKALREVHQNRSAGGVHLMIREIMNQAVEDIEEMPAHLSKMALLYQQLSALSMDGTTVATRGPKLRTEGANTVKKLHSAEFNNELRKEAIATISHRPESSESKDESATKLPKSRQPEKVRFAHLATASKADIAGDDDRYRNTESACNVMGKGRREDHKYLVRRPSSKSRPLSALSFTSGRSLMEWHKRLMHLGEPGIRKLSTQGLIQVNDWNREGLMSCAGCLQGENNSA
ncbi:hypothetical protein CROQUDRAFT_129873 [Cronartium quercuum f. sp. fusiforme G11]|uniref:GAG-pre-integrase domain-containing protein n=1 Tax=Cronartium quercuum f. sp. fusiforme G11 TaxID=708437 RepID=A0A9P6TGS4_9BASI|nr:hypothetical protein CROQUDRAFT_129873 [Cronartium quercuum f. sp. fusiforme G11]